MPSEPIVESKPQPAAVGNICHCPGGIFYPTAPGKVNVQTQDVTFAQKLVSLPFARLIATGLNPFRQWLFTVDLLAAGRGGVALFQTLLQKGAVNA